ncbi:hypothetical protein HY479_01975 [Candidatus Uhrbacteria bacterium]|nr:hypothetical protein [Candidatus Uhrbacteria bacterium]
MPKRRRPPHTPIPATPRPFRQVINAAAIAMLLLVSVPMFAGAVQGQTISETGSSIKDLITALTALGKDITGLREDIRALRAELAAPKPAAAPTQETGAGVPECLQSCRNQLAACLQEQQSLSVQRGGISPDLLRIITLPTPAPSAGIAGIPTAPATTTAPPPTTGLPPLDRCRLSANDCLNRCRPKTTTGISCEDRCATALGGCIKEAGTDTTKLQNCRVENSRCLLAACTGKTPDPAALRRLPLAACREQCVRDQRNCKAAAKYDEAQLKLCDELAERCLNSVCTESPEASPR